MINKLTAMSRIAFIGRESYIIVLKVILNQIIDEPVPEVGA